MQTQNIPIGNTLLAPVDPGSGRLARLLGAMLLIGVIVAPWIYQPNDLYDCWLPWMRATAGLFPWRAYSIANCNYPPFMLYVWTACEAIERLAHLSGRAGFLLAVLLVKLPNLLAYAGGAILCARGLRGLIGAATAHAVAVIYVLCLPVWFNAAVWGQCDAMLCLAMLAALIALLNDRPMSAGACVGWALSIKLQAIVIVPAAAVYTFRRFGLAALVRMAAAGAGILAVFIVPIVIAGYGHGLRLSYTGAVGLYPFLSIDTFNPWSLVVLFEIYVRHLPGSVATFDGQLWFGFITLRQIGLLAFSTFTGWLMIELFRRPTRYNAVLAAGLTAYGFFMLSTQMHERYVIPAAALLTLCAASGGGWIYLAVMIPALLNQVKGMAGQLFFRSSDPASIQPILNGVTLLASSVNILLFAWICVASHNAFASGNRWDQADSDERRDTCDNPV